MDNISFYSEMCLGILLVSAILLNAVLIVSGLFINKKNTEKKFKRGYLSLCLLFFKMIVLFVACLIGLTTSEMELSARILGFVGLTIHAFFTSVIGHLVFKMYREMWLKQPREVAG